VTAPSDIVVRMQSEKFVSPEPEVRLANAFADPFRNFVATARTCYSGKGIVRLEALSERDFEIARSIYQAGHHTTLQHAHFQFEISNVSRHFLWSFLHSHPFYNSEQVSQRYVQVKPGNYAIPPLQGGALELYQDTVNRQIQSYRELCRQLADITGAHYLQVFPGRSLQKEGVRRDIQRRVQEVARYVLPVATHAYLYHTVSGITLLRYWRLCNQFDTPLETRLVVGRMVDALLALDPNFRVILEDPLPLEQTPEWAFFERAGGPPDDSSKKECCRLFDADLGGLSSRLVDWKVNAEPVLASAVCEVLGLLPTRLSREEAIALVLDPSRNRLLSQSLSLATHSKLLRSLVHPHYTFRKKISHTADSQDQRHRMTPASRPILAAHIHASPDYITPLLISQEEAAEREFRRVMELSWERIGELKKMGVPDEFAHYLLPNAVAVRYSESGDLLNLRHKYAMRLCYNAQEEIWRASLEEVEQIRQVHPLIGEFLLPPCTLRHMAATRPVCPEGQRYCGVKVWKLDISEYHRII
jgi:thymidylate synthase ThyX